MILNQRSEKYVKAEKNLDDIGNNNNNKKAKQNKNNIKHIVVF